MSGRAKLRSATGAVFGAVFGAVALGVVGVPVVGCDEAPAATFPVTPAPASRHDALHGELVTATPRFPFVDGRWPDDRGAVIFGGVAALARRRAGESLDPVSAAQLAAAVARARGVLLADTLDVPQPATIAAAIGMIDVIATTGDRSPLEVVESFVDRAWNAYARSVDGGGLDMSFYGPWTVSMAAGAVLFAHFALYVGGDRAGEMTERALAIDARVRSLAFGDLIDASSGVAARGYATAPGQVSLSVEPNAWMLLLKARLFRLTQREEFRLEARALVGAIAPLRLASPVRYLTLRAQGDGLRPLVVLDDQSVLALALSVLFEITGDRRFIDEADALFDGIASLRGRWCLSDRISSTCVPLCEDGEACRTGTCVADQCDEGLLDVTLEDATPLPGFSSDSNFGALYALGYRRSLAGQIW